MADDMSLENTVVIMNGHHVQGWGDGNEVVRPPTITGKTTRTGADGKMEVLGQGSLGGPLMLSILPTAPSAPVIMGWASQEMARNYQTFNGSIQRPDGSVTQLRNGTLVSWPSGPSQGQGAAGLLEFTWEFETARPVYDGAGNEGIPRQPGGVLLGGASNIQ